MYIDIHYIYISDHIEILVKFDSFILYTSWPMLINIHELINTTQ